jgi:hypothetical protein
MRERAEELKAGAGKADAERNVLEAIAAMPAPDRALAERPVAFALKELTAAEEARIGALVKQAAGEA